MKMKMKKLYELVVNILMDFPAENENASFSLFLLHLSFTFSFFFFFFFFDILYFLYHL
jgi:hypothetical protein